MTQDYQKRPRGPSHRPVSLYLIYVWIDRVGTYPQGHFFSFSIFFFTVLF